MRGLGGGGWGRGGVFGGRVFNESPRKGGGGGSQEGGGGGDARGPS